MLQLKEIVKTYTTGDTQHNALKGINITFRENEFVSVLGQSGSGKTTMLNIIGGLDRYTSGDLVIGGVSTKKYTDSDWDFYRNNSIGFVFQSYNLIEHQTVLANVEMALVLAGVSKKERREKAIAVLEKVGLGEHIHKKPNQMSGGQMQRVAIARALINNPDILLADEPTGALDSETSVQIMELLKEIAKDKLVIMVTHNPELAMQYSTRIVKLLDGRIIDDTNPYDENEEQTKELRIKKISMSFLTALSLSFNNLRTKKGRTLLTAFAGSIGIIGIALVLALSSGLNDYIASVQKDTMSSYPITISSESVDMTDVMGKRKEMIDNMRQDPQQTATIATGINAEFENTQSTNILSSSLKENNLSSFKQYLDNPTSEIRQYLGENGIVYSYDLSFTVFSYDKNGNLVNSSEEEEANESSGGLLSGSPMLSSSAMSTGIASKIQSITSAFSGSNTSSVENFSQLTMASDSASVSQLLIDSYDLLYGKWPENYDEVILVLDRNNNLSAKTLYQLGFISKEDYLQGCQKIENGETPSSISFSYSDIDNHFFYLVTASDRYRKNENGTYSYIENSEISSTNIISNGIKLKISGIVRPNEESENATITTAIGYTSKLTDFIISHTNESEVVKSQEATPQINVLNSIAFEVPDDNKKVEEAKEYIKNLDTKEKASIYTVIKYYESTEKKDNSAETVDISNMSRSEKAANFDKWIDSADDEILLALFENALSSSGQLSSFGQGKEENEETQSSCAIREKFSNSIIGKAISSFTSSLISSSSSAIVGSIDNSTKVSLIKEYAKKLDEEQKASLYTMIINYNLDSADAETIKQISSMLTNTSAGGIGSVSIDQSSIAALLDSWLENSPERDILIKIFDEYIGYSTYEDNMESFGKVSYDNPSSISIYTDSFDSKDAVTQCIANYNKTVDENSQITYTDYVSLLTSSITTIIDTVSYAIIAFVAISLVVSCVMIGIITHISVMERTKEIGILRALGASKRNISQVFNAETFIIGCCAGLIGIAVSQLATIPINILIAKLTAIEGLSAKLPISSSLILIAISITITIIGGLLPAKKAAKKDPVIALRSE